MINVRNFSKDMIGGILIGLMGGAITTHSTTLRIGSLSQMGPGFFPFSLGIVLMLVGAAIAIKSIAAGVSIGGERRTFEWKAWLLICISIVSFIVLAKYVGLIAATFSIVFISAFADRENSWRSALGLAVVMVILSVLVFWWALKIPMPLFKFWGA